MALALLFHVNGFLVQKYDTSSGH